MKFLENRIPPPLVGLLLAAAMWGIASEGAAAVIHPPYRLVPAILIALAGLGFDIAGIASFRLAKTTVNPLRPANATSLVTSGVYRVTRNPMYLGMVFFLVAWGVYLASPRTMLGPVAFVFYMNRFQIRPEEKALEALFGEAFVAYAKRVRRWL